MATTTKNKSQFYSEGANIDANYGPWGSITEYTQWLSSTVGLETPPEGVTIAVKAADGSITKYVFKKGEWEKDYQAPEGGIPKDDLASAVQASLTKADSALQTHQSLANYPTKSEADGKYQAKGNYLTEHQDISNLATKQSLSEVDTKATNALADITTAAQSAQRAEMSASQANVHASTAREKATQAEAKLTIIQSQIENMTTPEGEVIPEIVAANVANNKAEVEVLKSTINGDEGKIIRHLNSLSFGGTEGYCAFDDVILSQDGDELAIELQTDSFDITQKAWSFATYDFSRISIALMSYQLGAKDASNNWLSGMNGSSGQLKLPQDARFTTKNTLCVKYADGKMQFIVGGQVVKEFDEQKTISLNRLGKYVNSSGIDYYWQGTIYSFDYTHNGETKSIVDMNLVTNGDAVADITEERESGNDGLAKRMKDIESSVKTIGNDVQVIKENMPSVDITEEEKSVQIPLTSFIKKENYYIGSTSGGSSTGNNTYYFIAEEDLSIYLKSEFAQGKTYRIGVGSGTITAYQWRNYASAYPTPIGQAPTLDTPWQVNRGELFAITSSPSSSFDIEKLIVEKKKYLTDSHIKQYEDNFEDIYSKIGGDSEDKLVIQSVSPTEFNVISVANRKILRYNFKRRRYTRNIGGSEVLCGDVWNNEMIFNKDDKAIIQGNTNFIIAIDGEKSGFADESQDFAAGPGHGCEIAEWTKFIADGKEFDPSNIEEDIECKEMKFVLSSNVHAVDATLCRANNTGNENNYPRVVDGQLLKAAHHYIDVSFSVGNKIEVRNRLTILRDNTIFRGCYAGMLQCYPIAFNEVSINDITSSLESFTSSQNHSVISGDGVIGWSPKKANAESFYGEGIVVSQYMESLNPDRYDKLNLFTPPSYADRVKTYFQACTTSVVGGHETFNSGYTFDMKIVRKIYL